jgi:two-component system, LuxR family, response regulator FixJ
VNVPAPPSAVVFVVDADPRVREGVRRLLGPAGVKVIAHESGAAVLADPLLSEARCVIAELRLPDMTGLDLLGTLHARRYQAEVLFLTGDDDVALAVRAIREGAADIVAKPQIDSTLWRHIQRMLSAGMPVSA